MKELEIKVGDLYEFVLAQGGKPEEENSFFIDVPFNLEIKDEKDSWIKSSKVYKKEDSIYEVEFEKDDKVKVGKYAAEHILPIDLGKEISTFVKDLQVGDELPNGFKVVSVKKVANKDTVYSPQADSETHNYKDIDGLIHHNTYSIKMAMENEFPVGTLKKKGYSINWRSGDIGSSMSNILVFFYKNREKKIIVLDDCDSFILNKDQAVQNFLKSLLDLDNTDKNPKYISTSSTIRNYASNLLNNEMDEGIEISIDKEKLLENKLVVRVNGKEVFNEQISNEDVRKFKKVETKNKFNEQDYFGLGLFNEDTVVNDDDEFGDKEPVENEEEEILNTDGETDEGYIPSKWRFTSRLIMISNLSKKDLNDAVLSRTLSYEMTLTHDEYLARLSEILPNLLTDVETESSKELVDYAKKIAYANLIAAVDINKNNGSFGGKPVAITTKLEFRLIAELAGKWMQRADNFASKNNIDGFDSKTLNYIANSIKKQFFFYDVMPTLVL